MTYELAFLPSALKEWKKLAPGIRNHFKKKLQERLESPCVPSARLAGQGARYKIKLRQSGYRLVYEVREAEVIVLVVAIGRRDGNEVYDLAAQR